MARLFVDLLDQGKVEEAKKRLLATRLFCPNNLYQDFVNPKLPRIFVAIFLVVRREENGRELLTTVVRCGSKSEAQHLPTCYLSFLKTLDSN
jgi:hypothetical protein